MEQRDPGNALTFRDSLSFYGGRGKKWSQPVPGFAAAAILGNRLRSKKSKMDRKFFVGGNWKMNGNKASIDGIIKTLAEGDLSPNTGL